MIPVEQDLQLKITNEVYWCMPENLRSSPELFREILLTMHNVSTMVEHEMFYEFEEIN